MVEQSPALLQLRALQTLNGAGAASGNTFVVGVGPDLSLLGRRRGATGLAEPPAGSEPPSE